MPLRRGLALNITSDMVKNYFQPGQNPNQPANQVQFERHQVGMTSFGSTRATSGIATPHFSQEEVQYYEQQMTLSNPDGQ